MFAETRGQNTYAYRTVRQGNTVKKVYLGHGAYARELLATRELKAEWLALAAKRDAEQEAMLWPLQQRMAIIRSEAKQGLEQLYLAANYVKTKCRHWRPRKMETTTTAQTDPPEQAIDEPTLPNPHAKKQKRDAELKEVCSQIKAGANHLRPKLRQLLAEEDPEDIRRIGDLTRYSIDQWALKISPENPVLRESIAITAMEQRRELAPTGSTYVDKVIADRLVLARLQHSFHDLQMAAVADNVDVTATKLGNALEKRLQVATRELREATKHYQKATELRAEISPTRPQTGVAALKIYNPDAMRAA